VGDRKKELSRKQHKIVDQDGLEYGRLIAEIAKSSLLPAQGFIAKMMSR